MTRKKNLLKLFSLRIYALISPPRNYRPLHYVELLTVGFPFLGLSFPWVIFFESFPLETVKGEALCRLLLFE